MIQSCLSVRSCFARYDVPQLNAAIPMAGSINTASMNSKSLSILLYFCDDFTWNNDCELVICDFRPRPLEFLEGSISADDEDISILEIVG